MGSRVILTLRNDTSLTINKQVLQRQVGDVTKYLAADYAEVPDNPDEAKNISAGISAYTYTLWDATTYSTAKGWVHCYVAEEPWSKQRPMQWHSTFYRNSIRTGVLGENHARYLVLIPKIMLRPSDVHLPFQHCRIQPPVRSAYSITINKAQG